MPNDLKGINPRGTETFLPCNDTTARAGVETINNKIGANSGIASLDANGKVPSSQLPSFVDDVVEGYYKAADDRFYEESTFETLITPTSGKSWVDVSTNKSYRWTGSVYVRVDEGVQIGETADTAFAGNRGKALETAVDGIKNGSSINSFGGVETALSDKVDKVAGKGLSANDYTNADKAKVDGAFPRSEQAVLGAKNLLPIKISTLKSSNTVGTWTGNTYAINNITLECTVDGEYVNAIKLNGTSNAGFDFYLTPNNASDDIIEQGHTYILSSDATLPEKIYLSLKVNTTDVSVGPTEKGKSFTASANVNRVCVIVRNGAVFDNLTLKPMISFDGGEYAPYAMTNRELTEKVAQSVENVKATFKSEAVITDSPITDVESAIKVRYGNLLFFNARINKASNTAINKNFSFPLTFPETLKSVCMININSSYGAGTASFDVNNKGMAVRYVTPDAATYVDVSMILLVA